jgi:thiamine biosynthesis lipoprotein ApbE
VLVLLPFALVFAGCSSAPPLSPWETPADQDKVEERTVEAMNTTFHIRLWKEGSDAAARNRAFQLASAELRRVAKIADGNDPRSEVSLVNRRAQQMDVKVSPELMSLINLGLQMGARTGGVFDVTFQRIQDETEKHGEDTGLGEGVNEAASDVSQALKISVGSQNLSINRRTSQVRFTSPGVKIGVLGMAKGYAAQKAAEKVHGLKIPSFAILGGGVMAAAGKALQDPNLMCVEHPNQLGTCAFKIVYKGAAPIAYFAASAVEERPGHIYNARNGMRKARAGGVTVAAADGASAQAGAVAGAAMDNKATLRFFDSKLPPRMSGVFFESDYSIKLYGSLEPFAKTIPLIPGSN